MKNFNKTMFVRFLTITLFGNILLAQTAQYPGALATTSDLLIASNRARAITSANIPADVLTIPVTLGSVFTAPTNVTIDNEIIKICTVTETVLTVCAGGRGFDGTTAAYHTSSTQVFGNINAWFHNATAAEIIAIEAFLGVNGTGAGFATLAGTNNFTGRQNAANAASTAPLKSGNTLPATCTANDLFYKANATSGQRIYACESTNTWVLQAGGGGGSVTPGDGILVVGDEVSVDPSFVPTVAGANTYTALNTFARVDLTPNGGTGTSLNCASTITFQDTTTSTIRIRLTGNCTASSGASPGTGQIVNVIICQDGTGSWTFTWPAQYSGGLTVASGASKCNAQSFIGDSTNSKYYALSSGVTNQ